MPDHFNTVAEKDPWGLVRKKMREEYGPGPQKAWEKQEAKERDIQKHHDAKKYMRMLMEHEYGTGPEQAWKRQERIDNEVEEAWKKQEAKEAKKLNPRASTFVPKGGKKTKAKKSKSNTKKNNKKVYKKGKAKKTQNRKGKNSKRR